MSNEMNALAAKAQIDFHCLEDGCMEVVKFNLADITAPDFQAVCPKCHKPTRVKTDVSASGEKTRVCKACGATL